MEKMLSQHRKELKRIKDGESVWLSFKAWVWAIYYIAKAKFTQRLIQEAEKPERNLVTATELDTVNSQEAVLDILDLIETFLGDQNNLERLKFC